MTAGQQALAAIDQVLAGRPGKDDHHLSQAAEQLGGFRDQLVARWRAGGLDPGRRKQLAHVNAVITVVLAIHFPLGEVPWHELESARAWLAEALTMVAA